MTLRHSLFDKIFMTFLAIFTICFGFIVFYASHVTRNMLVDERTEVLTNEAFLIADQTITGYIQGLYSDQDFESSLQYYAKTLNASIWVTDTKGIIYGFARADGHPGNPKNIFFVDQDFDMYTAQSFNGTFFGTFNDDVISVAIPIRTNDKPNGMILIHSTLEQLHNVQQNIVKLIYAPYLFMIIISFALLGIVSGKIMRPIRKINSVAEQYSTGNFDTPMDIHSSDEIGQLASTLEYMASELAKLDEYRKSFISNISHDFRSPLTSIKGYIEAIQDGTIPPEKQSHYLDIVVQQTNRLTKLTSSLLELNNYDSYGIWLVCKDFDIVDLVLSAINSFEGRCIEKKISLRLNNHTEHSIVHADKTKIEQVIYNLLDNAIKFTSENKSIYVTLTEKNDKIFVSVKDEGCGIPKESLNRVWVRFYKADRSRGKDKQGTGLGLAITKEIIKAHNENINVVSTEGVGSEFTFSLSKATTDSEQS